MMQSLMVSVVFDAALISIFLSLLLVLRTVYEFVGVQYKNVVIGM